YSTQAECSDSDDATMADSSSEASTDTALTVASTTELSVQPACGDSDDAFIVESFDWADEMWEVPEYHGSQGESSTASSVTSAFGVRALDESDSDQTIEAREPKKHRRPTRRGKGGAKRAARVAAAAEQAAMAGAMQIPMVEAQPNAPRKTRRSGNVIRNRRMLKTLPRLDAQND
ncbi:hypothetical protein LPJ73_002673, partial [Coemansia sp. RSA 2703]